MGVMRPRVEEGTAKPPEAAGSLLLPLSYSPSPFLLPRPRTACPGLRQTPCDQEVGCHTAVGAGLLRMAISHLDVMFREKNKPQCSQGLVKDPDSLPEKENSEHKKQEEKQPTQRGPSKDMWPSWAGALQASRLSLPAPQWPFRLPLSPQSPLHLAKPLLGAQHTWDMWAAEISQLGRKRGFQAPGFSLSH